MDFLTALLAERRHRGDRHKRGRLRHQGGLVVAVNSKTLKIFTALSVINAHAGVRFLTRALEIKVRSVFEVFFSEIRQTLGSVRHRGYF